MLICFIHIDTVDVDECANPLYNECEQLCKNTVGGYVCSCKEGYIQNGRTECKGILLYIFYNMVIKNI